MIEFIVDQQSCEETLLESEIKVPGRLLQIRTTSPEVYERLYRPFEEAAQIFVQSFKNFARSGDSAQLSPALEAGPSYSFANASDVLDVPSLLEDQKALSAEMLELEIQTANLLTFMDLVDLGLSQEIVAMAGQAEWTEARILLANKVLLPLRRFSKEVLRPRKATFDSYRQRNPPMKRTM